MPIGSVPAVAVAMTAAQVREAAAIIREQVRAGRLGAAAVYLRGFPTWERDRIERELDRAWRRTGR